MWVGGGGGGVVSDVSLAILHFSTAAWPGGGSERGPSGLVQGLCIQLGVCGPLGLENGFLKAKNKLDDMIKKKVVI